MSAESIVWRNRTVNTSHLQSSPLLPPAAAAPHPYCHPTLHPLHPPPHRRPTQGPVRLAPAVSLSAGEVNQYTQTHSQSMRCHHPPHSLSRTPRARRPSPPHTFRATATSPSRPWSRRWRRRPVSRACATKWPTRVAAHALCSATLLADPCTAPIVRRAASRRAPS